MKRKGRVIMKLKSKITGYDLIKNKEYICLFEYDSVYELVLDNGQSVCRNKEFFDIVL